MVLTNRKARSTAHSTDGAQPAYLMEGAGAPPWPRLWPPTVRTLGASWCMPIPNLIQIQIDSFDWFKRGPARAVRRDFADHRFYRQEYGAALPRLRVRRAALR